MKKTSIQATKQSAINQTINSTIQSKNNHCSQLNKYQAIELQTSDQIIDQNFKEGLDEIINKLNLKSKRSNSAQIRSNKFSIQPTIRKNQRPNSAFNNHVQLFQMVGTSNQKDFSKDLSNQNNLASANKLFIRLKTPKLEDYMKNVILSHSTKNSRDLSKKLNQTYIQYIHDDMTKQNFLNRFGNKKQIPTKKIVTVWETQDTPQNFEWKQMQQVISNAFPSRRSNSKSLKMKNRGIHKHTLKNNNIRQNQISNRNCQTIGITEGSILLNDAYQKLKKFSMTIQRPQTQKSILNRKKPTLSCQQQKPYKIQNEQLLIGSKAIIHP